MERGDLDQSTLEALAARIAGLLEPGNVIVLAGEVGAGKTTFVRATLGAMGVKERVTSPTYQLARSYRGFLKEREVTVNHLDLYRIEGLESRDVLELDDYLETDAVTFIEWAEPALGLLETPSVVEILHQTPTTRRMRVSGPVVEGLTLC